jgi:hypothetical protein
MRIDVCTTLFFSAPPRLRERDDGSPPETFERDIRTDLIRVAVMCCPELGRTSSVQGATTVVRFPFLLARGSRRVPLGSPGPDAFLFQIFQLSSCAERQWHFSKPSCYFNRISNTNECISMRNPITFSDTLFAMPRNTSKRNRLRVSDIDIVVCGEKKYPTVPNAV